MPQSKNKVITAEYLEAKDLLIFTLRSIESGKDQTYCWPSGDYLAAIGISSKCTPQQLDKHCSDLIGKEINFIIEGEPMPIEEKVDESKVSEISQECSRLAEEAGALLDKEMDIAKEIATKRFH